MKFHPRLHHPLGTVSYRLALKKSSWTIFNQLTYGITLKAFILWSIVLQLNERTFMFCKKLSI
jgi:hypothetical protein